MIGELFVGELFINFFLQSFSVPILDGFFYIISLFGNPVLWIAIAAWLFWLGKEKKSFTVMTLVLFSSLIAGVLKFAIARPRPTGLRVLDHTPTQWSMPSGHATLAGTIYSFFEKKVFPLEKVFLLVLVVLVAVSRLYLGVHYISDVLVGLLIGYFIGKFLLRLEKKIDKSHLKVSKFSDEKLLFGIFVVAIVIALLLPSSLLVAFVLLGYFAGFVIYRDMKFKINSEHKKLNLLFGTIVVAILGGMAYSLEGIISIILFFVTGLFITLIWPIVLNRCFRPAEAKNLGITL